MFSIPVRPGLELRLFEQRHSPAIFQAVENDRSRLSQWLPWVDTTRAPADVEAFIRRSHEQLSRNEGFHAAIWSDDVFCGGLGLKPIDWLNKRVEIGYWLTSGAEGKGIITSAGRVVIAKLFEDCGLNRIEIRVAVGNDRSVQYPRGSGLR